MRDNLTTRRTMPAPAPRPRQSAPELPLTVVMYIADDGHTKAAFELAVLQEKLIFRTSSICDREGMQRYEVLYDEPSRLVMLGFTFGSIFRS